MPRYTLSATVTVSAYTIVEANTRTDAIEIARDREPVIGGRRDGNDPEDNWIIEEADGMPQEIEIGSEE